MLGRSIGSGPATHLATTRSANALLLMSAYTSIRSIAKDMASTLISYLVKERFRNIDKIGNVKCPVLLLHGEKDTLIRPSHS